MEKRITNMAHFAEINENNEVVRVLVVDDMHEADGENYLANTCGLGGKWIKTSYNSSAGKHLLGGVALRKNFAGIGYTYDEDRDAFIPPKIFDSHVLDEETCTWVAPIPMPTDGKPYVWDEETLSWNELPILEKPPVIE
jgi:hypothetical protein